MQQQAVLGQEPRKQQPMPLLVGALRDQQLTVAAELPPLRPQAIPQARLVGIEMLGPALGEHAQPIDRRPRRALGRAPSRRAPPSRAACEGTTKERAPRASDDHGLVGVEVRLHASAQLVEVAVEILVRLDGRRRRGDGDALGLELLGSALASLVAAAGDEADAVVPAR